jgi:hypothetical protein
MPTRCSAVLLVPLLALALAACGGDGKTAAPAGATATTAAAKLPPLARVPLKPGEILFSGEASPESHGSFALDGRYLVRFEQFAPEDAKKDFSGETPFVASLRPAGSSANGAKLFGAKRASGQRTLTRHGRYVLDVTFGDFPYAVRFTPRR